ncbi:MAG TPA: PASTA domain-containing protein [Clostridiaceae bacterium]|nr:PASTA domain-containing protein [Clostridiaceae bacterium]
MAIPDVAGYTLEDAKRIITQAGFEIGNVFLTAPPRLKSMEIDNKCRVLRIKEIEKGKVELLVCKPVSSLPCTPLK